MSMQGTVDPEGQKITNESPADGAGGRKVDPGFRRNILIIGGGFAVAVALMFGMWMLRSGKADKTAGKVGVDLSQSTTGTGIPEGEQMSPAMREAIQAKQTQEREAAARSGQPVYLPPEVMESTQKINTPGGQASDNPALNANGQPAPVVLSAEDLERLARRRAGLERQLGALLTVEEVGRQVPLRVVFTQPDVLAKQNGGNPGQSTSIQSTSFMQTGQSSQGIAPALVSQGPQQVQQVLINSLEIAAAEVASPVDTYKTNYASARIVAGKLAGAFLIGTVSQREDGLSIAYTQMRLGNHTYQIDAIALDEKTSTNAMDADVDRRYLQRWVIPVATAMVGGLASAASKVSTEVIFDKTGGAAGTATPAATGQQVRAAGVVSGMGILQKEVDKEAGKPFQIRLDANTPIGILFRQPVLAAKS